MSGIALWNVREIEYADGTKNYVLSGSLKDDKFIDLSESNISYGRPVCRYSRKEVSNKDGSTLHGTPVGCRRIPDYDDYFQYREDLAESLEDLEEPFRTSVKNAREGRLRVIDEWNLYIPERIEDDYDFHESYTPFGAAEFEIVDDDLFFADCLSSSELSAREALKNQRSEKESVRRAKNQVEAIGRGNKWDLFFTLTFDDNKVDARDYDAVVDAFHKWRDCIKHRYPGFKCLAVPEKHPTSGRWHIHALASGCSDIRLNPSVKSNGRIRLTRSGDTIYNMPLEYGYGFTTVTRIKDSGAAAMYISKYIGKALGEVPPGKKRYWASRGLKRLKDITTDFLFEGSEIKCVVETLMGMADRVHTCFVDAIGMVFTYITVFPSRSPVAST